MLEFLKDVENEEGWKEDDNEDKQVRFGESRFGRKGDNSITARKAWAFESELMNRNAVKKMKSEKKKNTK